MLHADEERQQSTISNTSRDIQNNETAIGPQTSRQARRCLPGAYLGLRLHRRGRVGRDWNVRERRDWGSLLYWVRLGARCHEAQAGACRASRGGFKTPVESRRVGPHGEDHAGRRGAAASGEGAGRSRASHTAAPRARWCVESRQPRPGKEESGRRRSNATGARAGAPQPLPIGVRWGRQEQEASGAGYGGPRVADPAKSV